MVCIDCCVLLNQCSDFFEKTNQAQVSLRQLLVDTKVESQPIEPNIDYVEETVEFPKGENNNREEIVECQLPGNYISETANTSNASYYIEEYKDENSQNEETLDNIKQKKCKIQIKKSSPKQTKKRLKKKNQMQKMEETEHQISSRVGKKQNDAAMKNNLKIVDNYIPGKNMIMQEI